MLLDPLDCVAEDTLLTSSEASADSGDWVMETAPDTVCLETFHIAMATASTIGLVIYLILVLRLIRVGGNLASVEFDPRRYTSPRLSLAPSLPGALTLELRVLRLSCISLQAVEDQG